MPPLSKRRRRELPLVLEPSSDDHRVKPETEEGSMPSFATSVVSQLADWVLWYAPTLERLGYTAFAMFASSVMSGR